MGYVLWGVFLTVSSISIHLAVSSLYETRQITIPSLYPTHNGALRTAKENLLIFYGTVEDINPCAQVFPYGQ